MTLVKEFQMTNDNWNDNEERSFETSQFVTHSQFLFILTERHI